MGYNTVDEIRRRTAIEGNYNISTASLESKVKISDSVVNGYIVDVYVLPISGGAPAIVSELAGELACALILKEEYGPEVEDSDKDGFKKWDAAISILKSIQSKELKVLNDTTSQELPTTTQFQPKSFGDNTSDALTTTASTSPVMRMGDTW